MEREQTGCSKTIWTCIFFFFLNSESSQIDRVTGRCVVKAIRLLLNSLVSLVTHWFFSTDEQIHPGKSFGPIFPCHFWGPPFLCFQGLSRVSQDRHFTHCDFVLSPGQATHQSLFPKDDHFAEILTVHSLGN